MGGCGWMDGWMGTIKYYLKCVTKMQEKKTQENLQRRNDGGLDKIQCSNCTMHILRIPFNQFNVYNILSHVNANQENSR